VDLVAPPARPGAAFDLTFLAPDTIPAGLRLQVALASAGRTRLLGIGRGASRDRLRITADGGWVDLGPVGPGVSSFRVEGLLPGPFGFQAPLTLGGPLAFVLAARPSGTSDAGDPGSAPRWRLVRSSPASVAETCRRVLFFVLRSPVLALSALAALALLLAGVLALDDGRNYGAVVSLVASATLFHAALLPPLQGADETSHAATIEALVFHGSVPHGQDAYPASFSRAADALEQDRVQYQPEEPLPLATAKLRAAVARVFRSSLAGEALAKGREAPAAALQDADRRAFLFFRAFAPAAPLLRRLAFLDRVSAYRILGTLWSLALFAAGAALLYRASVPPQLALLYGMTGLFPYSIYIAATCSNYAPAIGLGQLVAAAVCAFVLTEDAEARRLAGRVAVVAPFVGILVWTDFVFVAAAAALGWAALRLAPWAGESRSRRAALAGAVAVLTAGACGAAYALVRFGPNAPIRVPSGLRNVHPREAVIMVLFVLAPLGAAAAAAAIVRRWSERDGLWRRRAAAGASVAIGLAVLAGFVALRWTDVPYEREWLSFPRTILRHAQAHASNALAWDQDRLSWKFWVGSFGWHDVFYPDAVYAALRWAATALAISFPVLALPFVERRPRAAGLLLLVSGAGAACCAATFVVRYAAPTVPYGRFLLPALPLALLPVLALLERPSRGRWMRLALFGAAALQVWTAIVVIGARYAFGA